MSGPPKQGTQSTCMCMARIPENINQLTMRNRILLSLILKWAVVILSWWINLVTFKTNLQHKWIQHLHKMCICMYLPCLLGMLGSHLWNQKQTHGHVDALAHSLMAPPRTDPVPELQRTQDPGKIPGSLWKVRQLWYIPQYTVPGNHPYLYFSKAMTFTVVEWHWQTLLILLVAWVEFGLIEYTLINPWH